MPEGKKVVGNPAFIVGESVDHGTQISCFLGFLKVLWLGFELYLFFGVMLLGQYWWVSRLPLKWRYGEVLKWNLLIMWFSG